jgi:hypothetical protein
MANPAMEEMIKPVAIGSNTMFSNGALINMRRINVTLKKVTNDMRVIRVTCSR